MQKIYGIYFYVPTNGYANVKLLAFLTKKKNVVECLQKYFKNFSIISINNTYCCYTNNNIKCIMWISTYDTDCLLDDKYTNCNQPYNSILIDELLELKNDNI